MHNHNLTKTYTYPMHPEIKEDHLGMCPEGGMALVPKKSASSGHDGSNIHRYYCGVSLQLILDSDRCRT